MGAARAPAATLKKEANFVKNRVCALSSTQVDLETEELLFARCICELRTFLRLVRLGGMPGISDEETGAFLQ